MNIMDGADLLKLLQETGKKYAVFVAHTDKPRAFICLQDGTALGMDKEMLQEILPMLQKALENLKAGNVPGMQ